MPDGLIVSCVLFPNQGEGYVEIWYQNETDRYYHVTLEIEILQKDEVVDTATVASTLAPSEGRTFVSDA